jgi:hypothetical protein
MPMPNIYKLIINSTFCLILCHYAMAQTDSTKTIASKKNNAFTKYIKGLVPIKPYYIGIDVIKPIYTLLAQNNIRFEAIAEAPLKNKNWVSAQVAYGSYSYNTQKLIYNSNSSGILLGLNQPLFPLNHTTDNDNAYIGIGYGIAISNIGQATYTISDIWGTTTGIIPSRVGFNHFAELHAGLRMRLYKRWMLGWRFQAKTKLGNSSSLAPLYIANYGRGDRSGNSTINLYLSYGIW